MKKLIYLSILLGLFVSEKIAGQAGVSGNKNEVVLNVNYFLDGYVFDNFEENELIEYDIGAEPIFQYRRFFGKKSSFKLGGSYFLKKSNEIATIIGFADRMFQRNEGYQVQIGYDNFQPISSRFHWFWGVDAFYSFQKFSAGFTLIDTFFVNKYTKIQRDRKIGIIPHLGLRYMINDHFSVSLKSNLVIYNSTYEDHTMSPFIGDPIFGLPSPVEQDRIFVEFQRPMALFLNYRFGRKAKKRE